MSIGLRIRELRSKLGMSQIDFANKLGIKQSPLSQMESGKIQPSIETISNIIRIFNISYSWLIDGIEEKPNVQNLQPLERVTKRVTFSEESKNAKDVTLLSKKEASLYNRMPKVVTVDKSGKDNIVLVPAKASAGYLVGYGDPEFLQSLPTYNLPNLNNGTFRMFPVSGNSMFPTLTNGCFVVGEWVENLIDIKDNRIYVIVSENGIVVKRVLNRINRYNNLYLKSDNSKEYPNESLEPNQIIEVWAVKMQLSFEFPDPTDHVYDRVIDLEAEIEHIKSIIESKN